MTIKEYLNQVFAHTEKTADTEALRQELLIEMKTQEETYILEDDMTPDEAEEEVLLKRPTPDEFREELGIKPNVLSETDRFFSFFRWFAKGFFIIALGSFLWKFELAYHGFLEVFGDGGFMDPALLFYIVGLALFLNFVAMIFIANHPGDSKESKTRKNLLIAIALLTHPIGIPTLLVGLMYNHARMQKNDYLRIRIVNGFKTKRKHIFVYSLTFIVFVSVGLAGMALARSLFKEPTETDNTTIINFDNTEHNRVYQTGNIILRPIENNSFKVNVYLTQFIFDSIPPENFKDAEITYNINGIDVESNPYHQEDALLIEDSFVTKQRIDAFIEDLTIRIDVIYSDSNGTIREREFVIGQSNITTVSRSDNEQSNWIWN